MIFNLFEFLVFLGLCGVLYGVLLGASVAAWMACRWLDPRPSATSSYFAVSMVLGPLMLSWLLIYLLALVPGWRAAYLVLVLLVVPFLVFLPRPSRRGIRNLFVDHHFLTAHPYRLLVLALLLLGLPTLFTLLALLPVSGNDTLEYLQAARIIYESASSRDYPFVDPALTGGFLGPWTHPPGYPGLLAFAFFVQGHADAAGVAKMVTPWFVIATLLSVAALARSRRYSAGLLAALFLLGTPLYYDVAVLAHVDIPRIAGLTAAIVVAQSIATRPTFRNAILLGLAIGLAMYTHSIGFLTLPLALLVFVTLGLLTRVPLASLASLAIVSTGAALLVVGPQIFKNLTLYGSVLQDYVALWSIKSLHVHEHLFVTRFMVTVWDRVLVGALAPFTNFAAFGSIGLLTVISLLLGVWRSLQRVRRKGVFSITLGDVGGSMFLVPALVLSAFLAVAVLSAVVGSTLIIKNPRYLLTVQPFNALLAAHLIIDLIYRARRSRVRLPTRPTRSSGPGRDRFRSLRTARSKSVGVQLAKLPLGILRITRGVVHMARQLAAIILRPRTAAWTFLILVTLWSGSHVGAVVYRDVIQTHRISSATLFDAEHVKRRSIPWPHIELESLMRLYVPREDKILVFRQADVGFFLRRPMVVYIDERLLEIFKSDDPKAVHAGLEALGIKWIYVPSYGMPEIYNSAFEPLLGLPELATLVAHKSGWRLFRVLKQPQRTSLTVVKSVDFEAQPELGHGWRVLRPRGLLNKLLYGFEDPNPPHAGPPSVSAELAMLTRRQLWRTLSGVPWPGDAIETPYLTASSDFPVQAGKYLLEAEVEGSGLVEVDLRLDERRNLAVHAETTPVWSGVLLGKRRRIVATFIIDGHTRVAGPALIRERAAQILFRVHQRASMRLFKWKVTRINETTRHELLPSDVIAALRQGWKVSSAGELIGLTKAPPRQDQATGVAGKVRLTPVSLRRKASGTLLVTSPLVLLNTHDWNEAALAHARQLDFGSSMMIVRMHVRGTGLVNVSLNFACRSADLSGSPLQQARSQHLGRVFATPEPRLHEFRFAPTCWPRSVQLRFSLSGFAHILNSYGHQTTLEMHDVVVLLGSARDAGKRQWVTYEPIVIEPIDKH